jgi:uncharacterized protein (UPF0128 family)
MAYQNTNKYNKALPLLEEVLKIQEEVLGKQHHIYAVSLSNLGKFYINIKNIKKGIPLVLEAYQILLNTVGKKNYYTQIVKKQIDMIGIRIEDNENQ